MIRLDIDLTLTEVVPPDAGEPFTARVTAAGTEVLITVNDSSRLPRGGRRVLTDLGELAAGLARRGVSVRVEGPDGTIVSIGDVQAGALQRIATGSPNIKLGALGALAPLMKRESDDAHPAFVPPPPTLFPLTPTLARNVPRKITTTHYIPGSGRPRLIFAVGSGVWDGSRPREFDLLPDRTLIGSGPDADLQLDGLAPIHAEIRHERDDEYVLYPFDATGGGSAPEPGRPAPGPRVLRTGARIELGTWRLAYYREEFADHGRPHGGRQGGELAIQKPQPPKPYPGRAPKRRA